MVVADVGANLGIFSLWSTRLLEGREHRVFAFEPAPDTLTMLRENIAINGLGTIDVVPAACADREGTTEFFVGVSSSRVLVAQGMGALRGVAAGDERHRPDDHPRRVLRAATTAA